MGNCFSVRTSSLALTSAMIWTLESWVLSVASDFANQGGKHWEKIYINEIVVECRITVLCLSPGRFLLLPCPFVPDTLPRETINENQIKVSSEHQTQKKPIYEKRQLFKGVIRNCSVFSAQCWGFSIQYLCPCICEAFGKSYWKHSWWWLPGERHSTVPKLTQKAYSLVMRKMNFK